MSGGEGFGGHVSMQVGEVRIMWNKEGMVHVEKERVGCVGREWKERLGGTFI